MSWKSSPSRSTGFSETRKTGTSNNNLTNSFDIAQKVKTQTYSPPARNRRHGKTTLNYKSHHNSSPLPNDDHSPSPTTVIYPRSTQATPSTIQPTYKIPPPSPRTHQRTQSYDYTRDAYGLWKTPRETIVEVLDQSRSHKPSSSLYSSPSLGTKPIAGDSVQASYKKPHTISLSSSPTHSPDPITSYTSSSSFSNTTPTYSKYTSNIRRIRSQSVDDSSSNLSLPLIKAPDQSRKISIPSPQTTLKGGLVGLYNSGNSCYMNSVLQCLSHTNDLTEYFLTESPVDKKTPVVNAYYSFLDQRSRADKAIAPSDLRSVMSSHILMVRNTEQQDAQEFLQYLLCCLHEEMNKPERKTSTDSSTDIKDDAVKAWKKSLAFDNSILSKLFMGQVKSTITCLTCRKVITNFETFWSLSLPLPRSRPKYGSISIPDCFRLYSAEEKLDRDNRPFCPSCKSLQPFKKRLTVQVFPNILILHLKRFTVQNHYCTKLSSNVEVPSTLTVEEIAADRESVNSFHYELYGVINHSGGISFGHYKADCKHNGKWYCFNDRNVSSSSEAYVTSPSPMPYVLFYEKKPKQ